MRSANCCNVRPYCSPSGMSDRVLAARVAIVFFAISRNRPSVSSKVSVSLVSPFDRPENVSPSRVSMTICW